MKRDFLNNKEVTTIFGGHLFLVWFLTNPQDDINN